MKVKVLRNFRDKHTKTLYEAGQEIEFTKERVEEINSTPRGVFVIEIEEKNQSEKKTTKNKSTTKK
jgi:hypothetical protein